jgi:hypothetical protein
LFKFSGNLSAGQALCECSKEKYELVLLTLSKVTWLGLTFVLNAGDPYGMLGDV